VGEVVRRGVGVGVENVVGFFEIWEMEMEMV
jgi:hypothetical protein